MLLDIIMTCQDNGRRMPKFTQTFFLQMLLSNRDNPYVATALEGPFSAFPAPQRYRKDSQLYSSAAASMLTNFKGVLQGSSTREFYKGVLFQELPCPRVRGPSEALRLHLAPRAQPPRQAVPRRQGHQLLGRA